MAFDMVVVRFLDCADFGFEAEDLDAVFAQHTGRRGRVREGWVVGAVLSFNGDSFAAVHREDLCAIGAGAAVGGRVFASLFDDAFGEGL